jgi:hypothetical protein
VARRSRSHDGHREVASVFRARATAILPLCRLELYRELISGGLYPLPCTFFEVALELNVFILEPDNLSQRLTDGRCRCSGPCCVNVQVFFFSFVFHLNVCPLFSSLEPSKRTLHHGKQMVGCTTLMITVIYAATGAMGFALFGEGVAGNLLSSFANDDHVVNAARLAILLCCFLCLPLLIHPLRAVRSACHVHFISFHFIFTPLGL